MKTRIDQATTAHRLATVFANPYTLPPANGSQAEVTLLETSIINQPELLPLIIEHLDIHITQVLVIPSPHKNCWHIRWFHKGHELVFCGHGTLAAAAVIQSATPLGSDQMVFLNGDSRLKCHLENNRGYLLNETNLIFKESHIQYDLTIGFTKIQCKAQYEVGGDHDYLLIELAKASQVKQFQPDFSKITGATSRAIILMAIDIGNAVTFRYFAPQYGNNEDQATGSAALIIGQYIARFYPHLADNDIALEQASSNGAAMMIKRCGEHMMVGGLVTLK